MNPALINPLVSGVTKILDLVHRGRDRRMHRYDNALTAIYAAANETRMYMVDAKKAKRRNRSRERKLVRLWTRAAVPARHIDRGLADRCLLKADLWIDPNQWTPDQVREFRIGIDQVYEYARQLLQE